MEGQDSAIRAAGIMYLCGNSVLLLKRARKDDSGSTWAFPGGKLEADESPAQAAMRESTEEVGYAPVSDLCALDFSKSAAVEFTTFLCETERFNPKLNDEHNGYEWADLDGLPQPLHPGVRATLDKYLRNCNAMDSITKRVNDVNGWTEIKDNPLSKVGVFPYSGRSIGAPDPNKIYMVYRPESELSAPSTIESFKLIPWVDDHTMLGDTDKGLTPAEQKGIEGVIGEEVYFKDDTLYGNIKIFSERLAGLIEAGKKELSAGYRCMYEMASGVFNGMRYDAVQRNIRGNHLALVQEGRMGPDVAVLDRLTFTFDSKELAMADMTEKEKADKEAADKAAKDTAEKEESEKKEKAAADKKAKDEAEYKEKADKEAKDAEEKKSTEEKMAGMDAALKKVTGELEEHRKNGIKALMGEMSQRDTLASQLSQHIGTFDHREMTRSDVAKYGVKKLGIACTDGQEEAVLAGFLHGRKASGPSIGMDSSAKKSNALTDYINGTK